MAWVGVDTREASSWLLFISLLIPYLFSDQYYASIHLDSKMIRVSIALGWSPCRAVRSLVRFTELADMDSLSQHAACDPVDKNYCLINIESMSVPGLGVLEVLPTLLTTA